MSVPDYPLEETLDFKFTTRAFATGVPTTLAGTPVVQVYEDNSVTQITAGITLTADFDSVTGLNNLRIVATAANGYESGKSYQAVISTGTVGGVSVVGEVVQQFSIERSPALRPTTAGRTLDVTATGAAGIDWGNVENPGTTNAMTSTTVALGSGVLNDTALATSAVNEIRDAILSDSTAFNGADVAAIVADTNELQTDWADGGRLDLILDARASQTTADAIETDTQNIQSRLPAVGPIEGTADSGTTTTMVDAARTEADTDYWKGGWILFTSGTINGQARLITGFTPASDTLTFAPATTQAVATQTYRIIPAAQIEEVLALTGHTVQTGDSFARLGAPAGASVSADIAGVQSDTDDIQTRIPAALVSGRMDSNVSAINDSNEAALDLEASAKTIVRGTAQTGTLSTTQMTTDLSEATDDHYIGRVIIWTSGVLKDQATDITDYAGTNGLLTYTAVTEAPSNNDTFVIV